MNIITAINNEKIFKQLKKYKYINMVCNDIQYKEGILEILEKNKNIQYIIMNENLNGQIKIEELIKKIKNINNKINIIIILNKKDLIKEEYLIKNKIKFIYEKEMSTQKILEIILNKNNIIGVVGNSGTGKTITTLILSELIAKYKNKKILIVEDNINNNSIFHFYKKYTKENNKEIKNKIVQIKNKLDLLQINSLLTNNRKDKIKIFNEINKIKNNYDYIFVDMQNINSNKIYEDLISQNLLILNPNILEINKIKKYIIKSKNNIKVILNNYNEYCISEKILNNIFKNKINIIGKIKSNEKYNLIINNNLNINYLDKKTINNYLNIIKKI